MRFCMEGIPNNSERINATQLNLKYGWIMTIMGCFKDIIFDGL